MRLKDIFQLILLAAIWGSSFLFLRILAPSIGVLMTLVFRITIAALVLMAVFAVIRRLPDYRRFWKQYLLLGLLNLVIPFALITFSIAHLNASIAAILNATTPLFTMIISAYWLKEKLTFKKLAGLFIGVAGLIILVGWIPLDLTTTTIIALAFSLLGSFFYGLGSVYAKIKFKSEDPMKTATGQLTAAAIFVLPLLFVDNPSQLLTPSITLSLLALALVCTALGYLLYFKLLKNIGSVNTSVVTLLVPVFSIIWSVFFLAEPITAALVVGLLLILASLKLVLKPSI